MDWGEIDGTGLRAMAPDAFGAYDAVLANLTGENLTGAQPTRALELARRRITTLLDGSVDELDQVGDLDDELVARLGSWPTDPAFSSSDRAALELTEQFVIDVSNIDDDQRARCLEALGDDAFAVVQGIYVFDHGLRCRAAIRQLFGVAGHDWARPATAAPDDGGLWPALENWMREVARLHALDPLTTELVRLRGARVHDCRQCRSLRNVAAVRHGGSEDLLAQIDDHAASTLSERHKVALALTDAMLWRPTDLSASLVERAHDQFTAPEALELVLDVGRNAANKIAVAFGADAASTDGVEFFELEDDGTLVYDVPAPIEAT